MINRHNHLNLEAIPGNYQYDALNRKGAIQGQWHKNRHNLISFLQFLQKNDKLLDAGCGSGNVILEFAGHVDYALGIDNNPACIQFLTKQLENKHINNANARVMDLVRLELKGKQFTKVIMTEILEHFSEEEGKKVLEQIKSILTPNGKLLITTPNYKSPWVILEKLMDIFNLSPKLWGEQHLTKFTPNRLKKILENSGFTIEKQGTLNFVSPFLTVISPTLADKLSYFEFKHTPIGNLLYAVAKPLT
ncbi:MAG: class I SAM-dependent methyltransferase [Patescibacteria group bacterium]